MARLYHDQERLVALFVDLFGIIVAMLVGAIVLSVRRNAMLATAPVGVVRVAGVTTDE